MQSRRKKNESGPLSQRYWDVTHRPLQCLVFLSPMVIAYEVGMVMLHGDFPQRARPSLAAEQLLNWFFSLFGASGYYLPGAALVVVLLIWHFACHHPWRIAPQPLFGMAGESVLLAVPLLFLNRWLPALAAQAGGAIPLRASGNLDNLLLSIGAGLYEELVFRLIVITLVSLLVVDVLRWRQVTGMALAVIVSSLLFAAHHYPPIGVDAWSSAEFAFRAAAGAYLAAVFVLRGFGLAVGCHVIYDVLAFMS